MFNQEASTKQGRKDKSKHAKKEGGIRQKSRCRSKNFEKNKGKKKLSEGIDFEDQ